MLKNDLKEKILNRQKNTAAVGFVLLMLFSSLGVILTSLEPAPSETSTATDSGFARPLSRHDHTAMPKDETVHDVGVTSTESDPDGWPRRPGILSTASTESARSVHAQPSS